MNIVLCGYYGMKNLGDDYLLYSILDSVSGQIKTIDSIIVISNGKEYGDFERLFPEIMIQPLKKYKSMLKNFQNRIQIFRASDVFVCGGGGLFPTASVKAYFGLLLDILLFKIVKMGGLVQIYGIDLCRVNGIRARVIWKGICKNADRINLRNQFSYNILKSISRSNKICYSPDITFSFETCSERNPKRGERVIKNLYIEKKEYVLWVLANPWSDNELKEGKTQKRYELLCKQIQSLCVSNNQNLTNVFLPFYEGADIRMIADVTKELSNCTYRIIGENDLLLEDKRLLFKYAKCCVSMRFHGIAFSLYHGIPVEGIAYAPKSEQMMCELGLEDFCVKFGIRKESGFFEEFDIDNRKLESIYTLLFNEHSKKMFEEKMQVLRADAYANRKEFVKLVSELKNEKLN